MIVETTASDEELVRLSRAGCLVSFEELVRRHEARIYRFVWQRCGCAEDARDLTQMVFVAAFQKLAQFHPGHSFAAWLFTIARNRTTDLLRRRRDTQPVEEETLVNETTPAGTVAAADEATALWKLAREVLSPGQFEAVWLHYQEDLSVADVARVTRQTAIGVKVRLFRARQKLGVSLREQGWLEPAPGPPKAEARRPAGRKVPALAAKV